MKSRCILCTGLLLLFAAVNAKAADCLPLKVRNPEGNYIVPGVRGDIVYSRVNGVALALDAYVQKRGKHRPAVLVIHGGGFTAGSRVSFIGQFLEMLTRAGYNWFALDYRRQGITNYRDSLDDVRAALQFIRCHAREFSIDSERIALLGEDTGAQLAALLAAEKTAGIKAQVLIGGVYDLRELSADKAAAPAETLVQASPVSHVSAGMPDTLVIHGTADREVPPEQATNYCESLKLAGTKCSYLPVENALHRPENWWPVQWGYKEKVIAWLAAKLNLTAPEHQPYSGRLQKDLTYQFFDSGAGLLFDAYVPAGRGPFPAVIIAHGGGWEAGDKVTYATPIFAALARAGFAWFSLDYRLTPQVRHQEQLDDLRTAISHLRVNAKKFRIDPRRIAMLGESASGQMVTQLAAEMRDEIAAVVSFYGVYDFTAMAGNLTPRSIPTRLFGITTLDDEAQATLRRFSPLYNVHKDMPPLLLICGTQDGLFTQHKAFTSALDKVGARYESFTLAGAPHGMENWEGHPEWMGYKQTLVDWLNRQLRR